jgi:hypothetical protein
MAVSQKLLGAFYFNGDVIGWGLDINMLASI